MIFALMLTQRVWYSTRLVPLFNSTTASYLILPPTKENKNKNKQVVNYIKARSAGFKVDGEGGPPDSWKSIKINFASAHAMPLHIVKARKGETQTKKISEVAFILLYFLLFIFASCKKNKTFSCRIGTPRKIGSLPIPWIAGLEASCHLGIGVCSRHLLLLLRDSSRTNQI